MKVPKLTFIEFGYSPNFPGIKRQDSSTSNDETEEIDVTLDNVTTI